MKKALSLLLSMLLACGLVLNAGALTLENVETTQETVADDVSAAALNEEPAVAAMPAEYDESYGQLILFANATTTEVKHVNATLLGRTETTQTFDGKTGFQTTQIFSGSYGVGIGGGTSGWDSITYETASSVPVQGTLTLFANVYIDEDTAEGKGSGTFYWKSTTDNNWTGDWAPWLNSAGEVTGGIITGNWVSTKPLQYSITDSLTQYGVVGTYLNNSMYCYSVSVYLNPTNAFWLLDANGENREFIVLAEETYTLPDTYNGTAVPIWTDGINQYAAGTVLNKAQLAGKTLEPVNDRIAAMPAEYDESYGQLIMFANAKDTVVKHVNATLLGRTTTTQTFDGKTGFQTMPIYAGQSGVGIAGGTSGWDSITYKTASSVPVQGTLTLLANVYFDGEPAEGEFGASFGYPTPGWIYSQPWLSSIENDGKRPTGKTWVSTKPLQHSVTDSLTQYGVVETFLANNMYCYSVSVYLNPTNAFWLLDANGKNRGFIVLAEDTYTLPGTYNDTAVAFWTDGTRFYAAGDVVNKADLAGKTLTATNAPPAPTMLTSNSIRFGTYKGLRFAAVVDLELRKDEQTEEYGFLVTRKELLEAKGVTNDTLKVWNDGTGEVWADPAKTVGLTENEVVFLAGRVYQKDSGTEIIYDRTGDKLGVESIKNGTAIGIASVLTNIPSGHYKDVFVVRPYVKIDGTYYYGDAKENSYYAVAEAIKNNTDEYAKLTDDQKQEIKDILSDASAS